MKYNEILKALIGVPTLSVKVDRPFPVIGEIVTIKSQSTWVKSHNYKLNDGSGIVESDTPSVLGQTSRVIDMISAGEFAQDVRVVNDSGAVDVRKIIRPMAPAVDPYYDVTVTKEIIRNDGETTCIVLSPEHGYDFSRGRAISARVYFENSEESPVISYDASAFSPSGKNLVSTGLFLNVRGIYDVEVDYTDMQTGVTTSKRINKLITVTPKLAPRSEAIEYLVPDAKIDGGAQSWIMRGENYPVGSTIVLKYDPQYGEKYPIRLRLENFKGTWDNPIILTIDQSEPFEINWFYYYGIYMGGCEHVVFDGRGYQNLSKGFKVKCLPEPSTNAFQAGGFSHELEFFEIELTGADFAGFMIKTDPTPTNPDTWFDNFKFNRLLMHHCYIHDTEGEACYFGYYGTGWLGGKDAAGVEVKYRAHHLYNCRIYRNHIENQGYDSFQMNNTVGVGICYNKFINGGYRLEKDQTSGSSLSISGEYYNNEIYKYSGPGIQFGIMGKLEIFNNLICNGNAGSTALLGFCNVEPPPEGTDFVDDHTPLLIHNNVLMSYGIMFMCRNTNQWKNVQLVDNFFVYKGNTYGGQRLETLAEWVSKGNVECHINGSLYDYSKLDIDYKFADSAACDYRVALNSPLANSGDGEMFRFDFRGYKNWYTKIFPSGPFMGIIRDPDAIDATFALVSMLIDDGNSTTADDVVSIKLFYKGAPTRYRIGESADLSDAQWMEYSETISYTFSTIGNKTLYGQLGTDSEVSNIVSQAIIYQEMELSLNAIVIGDGSGLSHRTTVPVSFDYSGTLRQARYRISENADLSDAQWLEYSETISYTFSTIGNKTLYGQLQNSSGELTEIKSDSISIEPGRKAVISIGWPTADINNKTFLFDTQLQLTKMFFDGTNDFFFQDGVKAGTIKKNDKYSVLLSCYQPGNPGVTSGDNSGPYPDVVMEKYANLNDNPGETGYAYRDALITIDPGNYRIRLFASITIGHAAARWVRMQTVVDGVVNRIITPAGYDPLGNSNVWLEHEFTVSQTGQFHLQWGFENVNAWRNIPLNVLEIEEL